MKSIDPLKTNLQNTQQKDRAFPDLNYNVALMLFEQQIQSVKEHDNKLLFSKIMNNKTNQ